jgi:hypothetical protein
VTEAVEEIAAPGLDPRGIGDRLDAALKRQRAN